MEALIFQASNPDAPHNNEKSRIISLNAAFICVASSFVLTRIVVRATLVRHVALEDYLMLVAGIFGAAFSAMNIVATTYGLGAHIYDLPLATLITSVKKVIQTLWICQSLYTTALAFVKLSIIASFHRIFPTKSIRWSMYGLGFLIIAVWIVGIFTTIFQCSPIYAAWDFQIAAPKCLPIMKVYYFTTAFSIVTDLILCILPLPFFWKLKLPKREKYIVSGLFAFGLLAAVASIMRITVLHNVQSTDVTIGAVPTLNWSVVEVGTGVICACVPILKPLFKRLAPGRFFSTVQRERSAAGRSVRDTRRDTRSRGGAAEETEMIRVGGESFVAVKHDPGTVKGGQETSIRTREFV